MLHCHRDSVFFEERPYHRQRQRLCSRYRKHLGPKPTLPRLHYDWALTHSSPADRCCDSWEEDWGSSLSNVQQHQSLWLHKRKDKAYLFCQWARIAFPQETPWNANSDLDSALWVPQLSWGSTRKSQEGFKSFLMFILNRRSSWYHVKQNVTGTKVWVTGVMCERELVYFYYIYLCIKADKM